MKPEKENWLYPNVVIASKNKPYYHSQSHGTQHQAETSCDWCGCRILPGDYQYSAIRKDTNETVFFCGIERPHETPNCRIHYAVFSDPEPCGWFHSKECKCKGHQ